MVLVSESTNIPRDQLKIEKQDVCLMECHSILYHPHSYINQETMFPHNEHFAICPFFKEN